MSHLFTYSKEKSGKKRKYRKDHLECFLEYREKVCNNLLASFLTGPSPPQTVRAVNKTKTSIRVTWDKVPSKQQNGNVRNYNVMYQLKKSDGEPRNKVVDAAISYLNLTGLLTNTSYTIKVSASNEFGAGLPSDAITVTTADEASETDFFLFNYLNPLL